MKKLVIASCLTLTLGFAVDGIYDQHFMLETGISNPPVETGIQNHISADSLFNKKAIHLPSVYFDERGAVVISEKEQERLKKIIERVQQNGSLSSVVTLIGHTSDYFREKERVKLNAWSSFWQELGNRERLSEQVSIDRANEYIHVVYRFFVDNGLNPKHIYVENRLGKDKFSTEGSPGGRAVNHRVDIALYGVK